MKAEKGTVDAEEETDIDHGDEVIDCGVVKETPKNVNTDKPGVFGEDHLAASYTPSLTMSGGRRRVKRKLSLTRRNDSSLTRPKCTKLNFSPTRDSLPSLPPCSVVLPDSLVSLPISPPAAVGNCPPSSSDTIQGFGQLLAEQPMTSLPKKPVIQSVSTSYRLRQLEEG